MFLKKVRRVITFNQNAWPKSCIDINTDLRKKSKNDFGKYFFEVDEQCSFWKNYGKCEKT